MRCDWRTMCGLILATGVIAGAARAAEPDLGADPKEVQATVEKALTYFKKSQQDDGGFSTKRVGPGISALVAAALLRNGVSPDDPTVAKTLTYLERNVKDNGGIYDKALANYTTCVGIMAFSEADTNGRYDAIIKNATKFIKKLQYDESKVDAQDPRFGGLGYDDKSRPDLSNTQYFLDALQTAGVGKDDPAVQRALKFVSRCQNLPGETNDQPFAKKAAADDKGGLAYTDNADEAEDKIKTAAGGLRSQGAMTYAGLKSFLYAGVGKDDPRVKAAVGWIRAHYTLDENPGQGQSGLYYYYHTFAKAMTALGEDRFADTAGKQHDWRRELFEALKKRQRSDGSWVNEADKAFGENSADLATAFAVLTLSYCKAPAK